MSSLFAPVVSTLLLLTPVAVAQGKGDKPPDDKKPAATKIDFEKQILPILEKNCVECHQQAHVDENGRKKRPKGGVMFDSREGIEKSKRGKVVVKGQPDKSLMIHAVSLPADDEDRMPPAKKGDPLAKEQIELLTRWIDEGASFGKWTGKTDKAGKPDDKPGDKPDDKGKDAGDKGKSDKGKGHKQDRDTIDLEQLADGLEPLDLAIAARCTAAGAHFEAIAADLPLVRVTFLGNERQVDDAALTNLLAAREHIAELVLARTQITDAAGATLAQFPHLYHLDLRETAISDTGVAALAQMPSLRSLNLFSTRVGDTGLQALAACKELRDLYVWQAPVTAEAVVALRRERPDTRIVFTADLPEPMPPAQPGARRR